VSDIPPNRSRNVWRSRFQTSVTSFHGLMRSVILATRRYDAGEDDADAHASGRSGAASETGGQGDNAPGFDPVDHRASFIGYVTGLGLAALLTAISFWVALDRETFWQPGIAIGLCVLAAAQMGIHLVFFLHLTTGPDNVNNALAVAFGVLIIVLIGAGTLWIMSNLNTMIVVPVQR
jgi:cytochrome o ubiquinol oxidase subunit IV